MNKGMSLSPTFLLLRVTHWAQEHWLESIRRPFCPPQCLWQASSVDHPQSSRQPIQVGHLEKAEALKL